MTETVDLVAYPDLPSRIEALEHDGIVYFPGLLGADEIAELRVHMEGLTAAKEGYDRDSDADEGEGDGFYQKHISSCFNQDPFFLRYLDKPEIIEIWEAVHGPDCHAIAMTSWITGPGRPDQDLHVDWQPFTLPPDVMADERVRLPVYITTVHFYLDDLYEELGPTKVIPGSHRAGRAPNGDTEWNNVTEQSMMVKAGDATIHRGEVWHRGAANSSDQNRYLLQVACADRMFAQRFPPYLNRFQFDEAMLEQATPRQRRMLGDHRRMNFD
jgi:hypothetical protein